MVRAGHRRLPSHVMCVHTRDERTTTLRPGRTKQQRKETNSERERTRVRERELGKCAMFVYDRTNERVIARDERERRAVLLLCRFNVPVDASAEHSEIERALIHVWSLFAVARYSLAQNTHSAHTLAPAKRNAVRSPVTNVHSMCTDQSFYIAYILLSSCRMKRTVWLQYFQYRRLRCLLFFFVVDGRTICQRLVRINRPVGAYNRYMRTKNRKRAEFFR